MTVDFAKEYLLDDCADCPENKDGECMTQSHCFEVKRMAIQALEQTRWISVSEGLPEELKGVLVYCPTNDNIFCAYLENGVWKIFSPTALEGIKEIVTAWMPLPQPYVPDTNDGKMGESEDEE